MDWIAKHEKHPEVDEDNQVDYAAIYEALGQLMRGEVPKDLNPETSQKLLATLYKMMQYAAATNDSAEAKEAKEGLSKYRERNLKEAVPTQANPFNLPWSMFERR